MAVIKSCALPRKDNSFRLNGAKPTNSALARASAVASDCLRHGQSDEFGFKAIGGRASICDFNATILHLMGLDDDRLTFCHNGFERRLTNMHGEVVREVLA